MIRRPPRSTLSLHDALPISASLGALEGGYVVTFAALGLGSTTAVSLDRKSTRLNSSHLVISYAVFCLKKKNKIASTTGICQSTLSATRLHIFSHSKRQPNKR